MTVEKETGELQRPRTDFYLKHIFAAWSRCNDLSSPSNENTPHQAPTKATNDPNSRIIGPPVTCSFSSTASRPIYGVQSLYFLNDTLLART